MKKNMTLWTVSMAVLMLGATKANAAGTYYMGNYQSPQQNYSQIGYATMQRPMNTYNNGVGNYTQDTTYTRTRAVVPNNDVYVGQQYAAYRTGNVQSQQVRQKVQTGQNVPQTNKSKFKLNAGLNHEFAMWRFDMNNTGSILHYDNIRWNVLDAAGQYDFNVGSLPARVEVGAKYGWQFGESTMIDDDISNGGYFITDWWEDVNGNGVYDSGVDTYIGQQIGRSLSVGKTDGGSMFGIHAGFGLVDFFKAGGVRFTPSVGYRYLKYKLETKNDTGLTVDTGDCHSTGRGTDEVQCDPILVMVRPNGTGAEQHVIWGQNDYGYSDVDPSWWPISVGTNQYPNGISTGGTYAYILPGVSHSYEVEWMGPYLAMDMVYDINQYNAVNGRVELGLPMYTATGDQPYRPDWQHPKSVEDTGGLGDAWHLGLGANYLTALTDSISLSLGFTFDYYSATGAEAKTYLNGSYYTAIYNELLGNYDSEAEMLASDPTAQSIKEVQTSFPCRVGKSWSEVDSVYRSLGIRVGIDAKF